MSLSQHCAKYAQEIQKGYAENYAKKDRDFVTKIMYKSIQSWIKKMSGNREQYPKIHGGLIGYDAESIAVLLQSGMDLKHVYEDKKDIRQHEWCFMEDGSGTIKAVSELDCLLPYWVAFSMSAQARKAFKEQNPSQLLGNAVLHPSVLASIDVIVSQGSIIGPFVWLSPCTMIGSLCTLKAHVSLASDVVIGDYSLVEQNVSIGQGVRIGEGVTIGQGAIIYEGVKINSGTVIQPGQIVKMDCGFRNPTISAIIINNLKKDK